MLNGVDYLNNKDNINSTGGEYNYRFDLGVNKILENKEMNKEQLEKNIAEIHNIFKGEEAKLFKLKKGYKESGEEQEFLDNFLKTIGIDELNEKTRYIAYTRLVGLRVGDLKNYLKSLEKTNTEIDEILDNSYVFVADFHSKNIQNLINEIETKKLLSPFYLNVLKGVHNVGIAMNEFHVTWDHYLIKGINRELEEKFDNDNEKIMSYLSDNNLFDKGHNGEEADRSYSVLSKKGEGYEVLTYSQAFPNEIGKIIEELDIFIKSLESQEDNIYEAKEAYINYLTKIKEAFLETNRHNLVAKWAEVDIAWMGLKTPFQIAHPLEFYEDNYRKAVAVEWDLRLKDFNVMESKVVGDIENMYEKLYDDIGRENYPNSYKHSKDNFSRVQLYVSSQIMYYGSNFNGKYSAQVVPNDEMVSEKFGKKIFAVPASILEGERQAEITKIKTEYFSKDLLKKYDLFVKSEDKNFYNVYDIETFGHEYGHTLWLDRDTEVKMNKTGVYKNIEEFKATAGGLMSYFIKEENADRENLIMDHVFRSVGLIGRQEEEEVTPYYCEALIHLNILFNSGLVYFNDENKLEIDFSNKTYSILKENYSLVYKELYYTYLEKRDAGEFLGNFAEKVGKIYLPKDKELRNFVEQYYKKYEKLGSEVDKEFMEELNK